jgi:hypothetical protein
MTGYAPRSGSFNTHLSGLSSANYITRENGMISLNPECIHIIKMALEDEIDSRLFDKRQWLNKLGKGPRAIYQYVVDNPGAAFTNEELACATGYKVSGSFNTYLSKLSTLGLIDRTIGRTSLAEELMEV